MRRDFGRLRDYGGVDIDDFSAGIRRADFAINDCEQIDAARVFPLRIGIGKMFADIAQPDRAQQGVANRVRQRVGVGMPFESARMRNFDSAQNQRARIARSAKAMRVESEANSKRIHCRRLYARGG